MTFLRTMQLTAALLTATVVYAQSGPSVLSAVTYTVKSERAPDLAGAIKEYNEVLRKAHWDQSYSIYRANSGALTMDLVSIFDKFAGLDATRLDDPKLKEVRPQLVAIARRINESFSSVTRVIYQINQDVSLPLAPEPAAKVAIWTARVKPGKQAEVAALFKSDYLPFVKSTGGKTFLYMNTRFGESSNMIRIAGEVAGGFAAFDSEGAAVKAMGPAKYQAFVQKVTSLIDDARWDVYTRDAELSYTAPK